MKLYRFLGSKRHFPKKNRDAERGSYTEGSLSIKALIINPFQSGKSYNASRHARATIRWTAT
jgi:hypothetical protein